MPRQRQDVFVYNDTTGLVLTSKNLAGRDPDTLEPLSKGWQRTFADGVFLPIGLVESVCLHVRVVQLSELTAQESSEWIDRIAWKLEVPCGTLALSGGAEYLTAPGDDEFVEESVRFVKVSPRSYLAEVFTYLPCVNAFRGLEVLKGKKERLGAYFRRTRAGERFPRWLERRCVEDPSEDPGHERAWAASDLDIDEDRQAGTQYIDLLLRLSPMPDVPPMPPKKFNWFPEVVAPRKPALCPLGLVTKNKRDV